MKKTLLITLIMFVCLTMGVSAALITTYDYVTGAYTTGDTNLTFKLSNVDLLSGKTATIVSGGYHTATIPADDAGRSATLTDGTFASSGLTVIAGDYDTLSTASLVLEYDLSTTYSISSIRIFAAHDGDGSRAFINCDVEVDKGSGYSILASKAKTGAYGLAKGAAVSSGLYIADNAGALSTGVKKIKITFFKVSHNSNGNFADPFVLPYPNQGTVLKEIDVFGAVSSEVNDWNMMAK